MNPLVSVVTGTYNAERYIEETLDSLFSQSYPSFESIVVDDASTDGTVQLIRRKYGDRVRLFQRTTNSGLCQYTRNEGIRQSRGTYVAFLDHDDAWMPEKLLRQVAFMESHPQISICHSYCEVMDADSKSVGIRHEGVLPETGDCYEALLHHCFITISSVMVRRDLFDRIGLFLEDPTLLEEDYEFLLRAARQGPVGRLDEVLVRYRKSSSGITSKRWQHGPRAVPLYLRLLDDPGSWRDAHTPAVLRAVIEDASHENSVYWRNRRFAGRAAWFAREGIRRVPRSGRLWADLFKSLGYMAMNYKPSA